MRPWPATTSSSLCAIGSARAWMAGKVAEVVDRQRNVGRHRFADWLAVAVVDGIGGGDHRQGLLDAVGNLVEDVGAPGARGLAPGCCYLIGGVQR